MINFLLLGETLQGLTGGAQRRQPVLLHEVLAHRRLYPALTGNSGKHTGLVVGQLLIKPRVADGLFLQQSVNRQIDVLTVERRIRELIQLMEDFLYIPCLTVNKRI